MAEAETDQPARSGSVPALQRMPSSPGSPGETQESEAWTRIRAHTSSSQHRHVLQNVKDWQKAEATALGLQVALHSSGSASMVSSKTLSKGEEGELLGRLYKPPKTSLAKGPPKPAVEPEMKKAPQKEVDDIIKRLYVTKERPKFAKPSVVPEKKYVESVNDVVARLAVPKVKQLGLNESGKGFVRGGWGCQWDI
eukprot:tig00000545_g2015.t1